MSHRDRSSGTSASDSLRSATSRRSASDGGKRHRQLLALEQALHPPVLVIAAVDARDGRPSPGRLSNSPRSVASRICRSTQVSNRLPPPDAALSQPTARPELWQADGGAVDHRADVVLIVGLAAIVYGALADRRKIAALRPRCWRRPRDHPPVQSRCRAPALPVGPPRPSAAGRCRVDRSDPDEREEINGNLIDRESPRSTRATPRRISSPTDPRPGRSSIPAVLVCADPVSMRELLPVLEKLIMTKTPVVVVAPHRRRGASNSGGEQDPADDEGRRRAERAARELSLVAASSGATPVDRADRQSGYVRSTGSAGATAGSAPSGELPPAARLAAERRPAAEVTDRRRSIPAEPVRRRPSTEQPLGVPRRAGADDLRHHLPADQRVPAARPAAAGRLMRSLPTGLVLIIGSRLPPRKWIVPLPGLSVLYSSGLLPAAVHRRLPAARRGRRGDQLAQPDCWW